jgi:carbohydrate kinase (thermoresistant glucokinase family)
MASEAPASRAYVLYGVAGCGKTTLGRALVERLNDAAPETGRDAVFVDADDLHSPEAREKMSRGEPLTETDREPWLARVRARMLDSARPRDVDGRLTHRDVVVACSALRRDHRASLVRDEEAHSQWLASVDFVFLRVHAKAALEKRLRARQESSGHFFPASLLQSQLDTLELPSDDARTACHVFDADVYPSTNEAVRGALLVRRDDGARAFRVGRNRARVSR